MGQLDGDDKHETQVSIYYKPGDAMEVMQKTPEVQIFKNDLEELHDSEPDADAPGEHLLYVGRLQEQWGLCAAMRWPPFRCRALLRQFSDEPWLRG